MEVDLITMSQGASAFLGAGSFCLRTWFHRMDWALKNYNFTYDTPSEKILKNKNIFYLAITLKMICKNYKI